MSGFGPNEVEERRVIRLLAEVADDVTPLFGREVDELVQRAMGGRPRPVRRPPLARRFQHLSAAAAAIAVVVGGSLALTASQPQGAAPDSGSADARLASFPEGSALGLLLSSHPNEGRS
jgi:hypothetical protein